MKTKTLLLAVLLLSACAWRSFAQPAFDSSGDGQLSGAYYMRQVVYLVGDSAGDLSDATNIQGEITFSGDGTYSFSGSALDYASGSTTPTNITSTGTYVISASGEGYISAINVGSLNSNINTSDQIVGLVSHLNASGTGGIFIGSTTENINSYVDLFIAVPIGSAAATNATLNGAYTVAYIDPTFPGDALLTMTANGQGNIGTVNVTGYVNNNTSASTQTLTGVTYSFQNGSAQINFGGSSSNLVFGTEVLYISPDRNFIFGGSALGYDMFVGVLAATSAPSNYDGLYYQAGLDLIEFSGGSVLDGYFGSLNAFTGEMIGHQRLNTPVYGGSEDYTYFDNYTLNKDGSSDDVIFAQHYLSSSDGTIRIGYGIPNATTGFDTLSLNVALQAPAFNASGVYLSPVGVVNAASSAPFTAFLSPGEFLTLYGSGLAPTTNSASVPFPNNLSGVQVLINQTPAPIYYVSPTQLSVIVPYATTTPGSVAKIQVINNGTNSNVVTQFTGGTSVGAFTNNPVGGTGIAAAERPDFSVVSESNPAQVGETISLYLAGMGAVTNQPADGAAAPSGPLSMTTNSPTIYVYDANGSCPTDSNGNCVPATATFSGLAPGFAGLYQINFTIPSGLASGDGFLEIQGPGSDSVEAVLPLTTATSAATPAARAKPDDQRPHYHHHRSPAGQLHLNGNQRSVNWRDRIGKSTATGL